MVLLRLRAVRLPPGVLSSRSVRAVRAVRAAFLHVRADGRNCIVEAGPDEFQFDAKDPTRAYLKHLCDIPLSKLTTGQVLQRSAERFPDRNAIVSVYQNKKITFKELLRKADCLAAGLRALGLNTGDRVAIWGPNSMEWCIAKMAVNRAGLVLVTLNPAYQANELSVCLRKVGARALICNHTFKTQNYPQIVLDVAPEIATCTPGNIKSESLPDLKALITITDELLPGSLRLSEAIAAGTDLGVREIRNLQDSISCYDASEIQFTSGTTGDPKAVVLTHHNMVNQAVFHNIRLKRNIDTDRLKVCSLVPFFHVFASVIGVLSCVEGGDTLVIPTSHYSPPEIFQAMQKEKVEVIFGAPTMFVDLLVEVEKNGGKGFESVDQIFSGAALATQELITRLQKAAPHLYVRQGYGMTETSPATFSIPFESDPKRVLKYVGQLVEHLEAKVVDRDGNTVKFGEPGELLIRGNCNCKGYWNDEKKTKEAFTEDGWLRTGDQFILEKDGYARIVGRLKELVIRGGENIAPKEVEDALCQHPDVLEATVFGVPDERMGEEVAAGIRLKNSSNPISPNEIRSFLKGKIAHFKIPRYVEFMDDFPKTASGKVQKFKLQESFATKIKEAALSG